jgi:hypothetical protein
MTRSMPATPAVSPMPRAPSTPVACASSTYRNAPCASAKSRNPTMSARSPSMEKTLSVTISRLPRSAARSSSNEARCAKSLCRNSTGFTPPSRVPCTRLEWFSSSANSIASGAANRTNVASTDALACHPLASSMAASCPFSAATLASIAACASSVPHTSRDAPAPVPSRAPYSAARAASAGAARAQIVVRRKIQQRPPLAQHRPWPRRRHGHRGPPQAKRPHGAPARRQTGHQSGTWRHGAREVAGSQGKGRKARALPWTRWGRRPQTPILFDSEPGIGCQLQLPEANSSVHRPAVRFTDRTS